MNGARGILVAQFGAESPAPTPETRGPFRAIGVLSGGVKLFVNANTGHCIQRSGVRAADSVPRDNAFSPGPDRDTSEAPPRSAAAEPSP